MQLQACRFIRQTEERGITAKENRCSPIREKEVEAIFTINGRTYKYIIPEGTCWNKGYKYSYKLYFDGKDIRLHDSVAYIWTPKLKKK